MIIVDAKGRKAAFTGRKTVGWKGHYIGENYVAAGNMLTGKEVIQAMAEAFEESEAEKLAERLLMALEAGQEAGGDKRGKTSAALKVYNENGELIDLRVDFHEDPIKELIKIFKVYTEWFK